jgi:lysosome membrane protein 2
VHLIYCRLNRSLYLVYNKTEHVLDDIEVYTFAPEAKLFAFHTDNPDNEGFCVPAGNCLPAGVLNLTTCQQGIPIIMSSPHFLYADERFLKDVDGLNPDALLHNTFLSVEPTTGLLMKANKRLQFNIQLFEDNRV